MSNVDEFEQELAKASPPVANVLKHFKWWHLPSDLQKFSEPCAELAMHMVQHSQSNAELTVGLRKLLEAKDAFVRAQLP